MKKLFFSLMILCSLTAWTQTCPTDLKRNNGNAAPFSSRFKLLFANCPDPTQYVIQSIAIDGVVQNFTFTQTAVNCANGQNYIEYGIPDGNTANAGLWNIKFLGGSSAGCTLCNSCTVLTINGFVIKGRVINENIELTWTTKNYEKAILQSSNDGIKFNDILVLPGHAIRYQVDALYYRIKFVNNIIIYSNIIKTSVLNFSKPYNLRVYDLSGHYVGSYSRNTQYKFDMKGTYYLVYTQDTVTQVIKYMSI